MNINDKVQVMRLDINEQNRQQEWKTCVSKGVVVGLTGSHAKVWDVSDPTTNLTPANAEWFALSARRQRVQPM